MSTQKDIGTELQKKGEQKQLIFRKHDDQENTARVISSMNAARRSMGIAEIQ